MVGLVLPYFQFLPWLAVNGMNFELFFHQLFANRISAFFGMDVLVSAVTLMVFVRNDRPPISGIARWLPLIAVLAVGVSLALPLFLYLREENARAEPIKTLL
jgi:Terpene cyclase DEP1